MDKWCIFSKSDIECVMFGIRLTQCLPYGMEHINDVPVHITLSNSCTLRIARMILVFRPLYSRPQVLLQGRRVGIEPDESPISPYHTVATPNNARTLKVKNGTSWLNSVPTLDEVALYVVLVDILLQGIRASLYASPIMDVIPMVAPLQVINAIVGLILVLVVNLWVVVGIGNKGECYKAMNSSGMSLPVPSEVNRQVSLAINTWFHKTTTTSSAKCSPHSSQVANLVDSLGVNVFPNFFHISWPKKRKGAYCRGLGQEMILSRNNSPIMGLSNVLLARPRYKEITTFHNKYTTLL